MLILELLHFIQNESLFLKENHAEAKFWDV